jgi:hypothetical protein
MIAQGDKAVGVGTHTARERRQAGKQGHTHGHDREQATPGGPPTWWHAHRKWLMTWEVASASGMPVTNSAWGRLSQNLARYFTGAYASWAICAGARSGATAKRREGVWGRG